MICFVNRFESVIFLIWNRNGAISDTILYVQDSMLMLDQVFLLFFLQKDERVHFFI